MITKIVSYFMLGMLFFAFFLAIVGVTHIDTGEEYYKFFGSVSQRFESWKIDIPNIPKLENINQGNYDSSGLILQVLIKIANFFVGFINVVTRIVNVGIMLINIVIQLIQFICTFLYSMKDLIARLKDMNMARTIV